MEIFLVKKPRPKRNVQILASPALPPSFHSHATRATEQPTIPSVASP